MRPASQSPSEQPAGRQPAAPSQDEYLGFVLAGESYALPLSSVHEIMNLPPVTEVPRGPHHVLGIISVRGQVVTLVDLRRRLKLPEAALTPRARVLLVQRPNELLGLLVDRVLQVHRLRPEEVELAAVMGSDLAEYIMGIGRPGSRPVAAETDAGSHRASMRRVRGAQTHGADILILLDPVALLKG